MTYQLWVKSYSDKAYWLKSEHKTLFEADMASIKMLGKGYSIETRIAR